MTFSQLIYHLLGFFLGNQTLFLELFYPLFSLLNNIRTELASHSLFI